MDMIGLFVGDGLSGSELKDINFIGICRMMLHVDKSFCLLTYLK